MSHDSLCCHSIWCHFMSSWTWYHTTSSLPHFQADAGMGLHMGHAYSLLDVGSVQGIDTVRYATTFTHCICSAPTSTCTLSHSNTLSFAHKHTHTLIHHPHTHSHTLTHTLSLSLTLSHTNTPSHSHRQGCPKGDWDQTSQAEEPMGVRGVGR